jgi:nitroreductase
MVRNFVADPIDPVVVDRIIDAGRRGPSAGFTQGTELLVLEGREQTARYWDAALAVEDRAGFPWPGLLNAPLLILPLADADAYVRRYAEADKAASGLGTGTEAWKVPYWHVDASFAAMLMLLAVVDEGLGALFFGLFDHEPEVLAEFGVPDHLRAIGTIAVGHPAPDRPSASLERGRRPFDEVVHRGGW